MSFATIEDLAASLQVAIAEAKEPAAQLALDSATGLIQAAAHHPIEKVVDDEVTLDGPGPGKVLFLPHFPVTAIAEVKLLEDDTVLVDVDDFSWDSAGILTSTTSWPSTRRAVSVKYTHGFDPLPAEIKHVCLEVAKRLFDNPRGYESRGEDGTTVNYPRTRIGLSDEELSIVARYR